MKMKSALLRLTLCFIATIFLISLPIRTYAWGSKGHRIVAELLSNQSLPSIADAADLIRSSRPVIESRHFVVIQIITSLYP